jgi:hypothetical protein
VVFQPRDRGWAVEALLPWASLGAKAPQNDVELSGDFGILVSDPNGVTTVDRFYWANTSSVIMSDLPAEARLHPNLWGTLKFDAADIDDIFDDIDVGDGGAGMGLDMDL